jgi:predicted RNA-binding Zn-ribbon protein involved in translation (DUF1610 family)
MTSNPRTCTNCGAALSLQDLTRPNCPYCGQVLQHHARAAEHAALVNQVLQQQMGANNPWLGGASPPQIPYQYGAPMQSGQSPMPFAAANAQIARAVTHTSRVLVVFALLAVVGVLLAAAAVIVAMALL